MFFATRSYRFIPLCCWTTSISCLCSGCWEMQHCCAGVDHHHRRRSPRRFLKPSLETTVLFQSPAFVTHLLYLPRFEDPLRDWLLWLLLVIVAESSERFYPPNIQASLDLSVDRSFTLRRLLRLLRRKAQPSISRCTRSFRWNRFSPSVHPVTPSFSTFLSSLLFSSFILRSRKIMLAMLFIIAFSPG